MASVRNTRLDRRESGREGGGGVSQDILSRKLYLKRQALRLIRAEIRELKRERRRARVKDSTMRLSASGFFPSKFVKWIFNLLNLKAA
jgi:hypothetical protein